jgi:hypothetical protein
MRSAAPPGYERASPMPNANTKAKTRAARPTLSVPKESLKRQTFLLLSDQARTPMAPGHEPRFARWAQVLCLDEPRREA